MKTKPKKKAVDWDIYETDMGEIKKILEYLVTTVKQTNSDGQSPESKSLPKIHEKEQTPVEERPLTHVSEPMVFNILRKPASDVVTTKCRINKLTIPSAVLDSGANCSIMSKNIAKKLGFDIDTSRSTALEGVATESDTIGWVYNVPVSIGFFTLLDDFIVVDDNKPALLLGTPWLDRAQAMIDFQNRLLYIRNSADLMFNVPISVHKSKDDRKSVSPTKKNLP